MLVAALGGPTLAPADPAQQVLGWRFLPPLSPQHLLGGDNLGRDIFSRVVAGARISIFAAAAVVLTAATVGSALGAIAGYFGGWIDSALMRLVDLQLAFPFLLLALMVMAVLGPGFWTLVLALSLALWVNFARVVRGQTLQVREMEFIAAAHAAGTRHRDVILRHILPNVFASILVLATLDVALVVIAEAALSFLGLGVQPPTPSWGSMISEGRDFLADAPAMVLGPGAAILMTSIGINLFGDFLRDAYDPQLAKR